MMPLTASRAALRPTRFALRQAPSRHASTTSEAANAAASSATKAKESAATASSKASQGLSRVSSSAGSALGKAGPAVSRALGRVGGRTGRLIGFVQSLGPPTVYYSKVVMELSKMVFHGQKMYPPSLAQIQEFYSPLLKAVRNPQTPGVMQNPQQFLAQVQSINRQQLATYGVMALELFGFYKVGEIIGRRKLIGYRGNGPAEEHH